ncbi:MAG: RluA family pseudouridine synthase [Candidatus Omnitrophica bacterium]|nr:RluA family pseudouridine synthase [Candidatus Omnitrophota bacterium]
MDELLIQVTAEQAKMRLDMLLSEYAGENSLGFSRTILQKLIKEGKVFVNSKIQDKPHHKVAFGDNIQVIIPKKEKTGILPEEIPLDVVYEDQDLLVINKPTNLVVHPAPGNPGHTLVNALLGRAVELSDVNKNRPGIVHRLDKETSGLLVIAKNNSSHLNLARQFAQHTIEKTYVAIVCGKVEFDEDVIEAPIGRDPLKRKNMAISYVGNTKYAKTYYRTLKRGNNFSFLELKPHTGRTHQLRVHLAYLGHPILGDTKYGKNKNFPRLALHAKEISFIHPATKQPMRFTSKIPQEFQEFIKNNL